MESLRFWITLALTDLIYTFSKNYFSMKKLSTLTNAFILALLLMPLAGQAQGSLNTAAKTPVTRAALLAMGDRTEQALPNAQITDLVNLQKAPRYADGKFYLYPSEFYAAPLDRQLLILRDRNSNYLIIPEGTAKPKSPISRREVEQMSPEKRKAILNDPLFEVVD
jgi:hypothetical protein